MEINVIENSSLLGCCSQCVIECELNEAQDCVETRALATQNSMNFAFKVTGKKVKPSPNLALSKDFQQIMNQNRGARPLLVKLNSCNSECYFCVVL